MPKQYEDIRDSYESRGVPAKRAKKLAAMTYNAHRAEGAPPVTRNSDATARKARLDKWAGGKRRTSGE
jgi:hypothetical protein